MGLSLTLDGQPVVGYSNLQIKSVARGGFASVTFNLNRKLDKSLLATFTNVMVYDTKTGEQVGGGRLMEQGRNDDGTWGITCLGEGLASMQDRQQPLLYVDSVIGNWYKKERTTTRLDASATQYPNQSDDDSFLVFTAKEDKAIGTNASVTMTYPVAELCNMQIGGIQFRYKSGVTDGNMRTRIYAGTVASPYTDQIFSAGFSTATSSTTAVNRNGGFSGDRTAFSIRWFCNSIVSGASVDDAYWSVVRDIVIRSQIYGNDGALRTSGYNTPSVRTDELFTDVVIRLCPRLKLGTVTTTTQGIDQMVYLDGITAMGVLEDALEIEQAFNWDVYERDTDGKWAANLVPYPSSVRYEADVADGFSAPSPTTEIYNRVTVTGKSPSGRDVNVTRTSVVPDLDNAGIVRQATIEFGSEVWSTSSANKAGDDFLASHKVAPNAGTLTVARKIKDNFTGRYVDPCHIRPNTLVLVRGVQPTPDTLNATSPDGSTVFYVESMTFDDDSGAATLELDTPTLDISRAVAKLARSRNRR